MRHALAARDLRRSDRAFRGAGSFVTRRRALFAAAVLATLPSLLLAQDRRTIPRIGLLWIGSAGDSINLAAFRAGLRLAGYTDGDNLAIDTAALVDRYERLAGAAEALVDRRVDVIVAYGATAAAAAKKATSTIPIVMLTGGDPVKLGLVASLSRPGGNVTGVTFLAQDLVGKRLEILTTAVPGIRRIGVLLNPASPGEVTEFLRWETAARALNIAVERVEIRNPAEIDRVISGIPRNGVDALALMASTMFVANRSQMVAAIGYTRLPAIYTSADDIRAGGLISYGSDVPDGFRRAAYCVAKILKGARPADIPFEQPTKFELVVNLKTARQLGVAIPQSVLVRADDIIPDTP